MKTAISLASTVGLALLLTSRRSSAVTCDSSTLVAPLVVEDTAGALQLAQAINCSGGIFEVSWVGSVTVEETIRVFDGTDLSVVGTPDGLSFVDGGGEVSLFHVSSGTLRLSGLSLVDGIGEEGGAINAIDSVLTAENCTFSNNAVVVRGGAIVAINSNMTAEYCTFSGNTADWSGGAIYAWGWNMTTNSVVDVVGSVFTGNSAKFGGGVHALELRLIFDASEFSGNYANVGGAIYMADTSELLSDNCTFSNNSAVGSGGAVYVSAVVLTLESCTFSENKCGLRGGAVVAQYSSVVFAGRSVLKANQAGGDGGAVSITSVTGTSFNITFSGNAVVEDNQATGDGGGVCAVIAGLNVLAGGSLQFIGNGAEGSGGGISLVSTTISVDGQASFTRNSAGSGGGMHAEASPELQIEGISFLWNSAETTGGAMSVLSVGETEYPAIVAGCSFHENEAGDAGGAVFIAGGFVSTIGCDFDGNSAGRAGGALLATGTANLENCSFSDNHAPLGPAVSNVVTVELNNAHFGDNTLWCDDDSLFLDWTNASAYEIACDACPVECSYCTTSNPDSVQLCESVIKHTTSPTVDGTLESLDLAPGYWRSSSASREIRECYEADACVGGTDGYCGAGYDGPFCAVCAERYSRGVGYTCSECDVDRRNLTIGVALVLFGVAAVVGAMSLRYLGSSAKEPAGGWIQSRFERSTASQGLKIIIVSWQIVSQFSSIARVTYPDLYETFVGYIDVIDLDLGWMLSAECWIDTDFYDTLLLTTIGPLVVSGLVLASYVIRRRRCHADDQDRRSRIKHRHATFMYLISFLVYSTASSTIFQTFACDDIDTGESFLRADHSIQCYATEHRVYMAYAGFMCLLYPFGIPFCYAVILYRAREGLKSDEEAIRTNATVLRALWAPYRQDVYCYEVVECFRRVTLSGLVVFILPNTAGQVITTFLLSLFFFAVFMVLDPYTNAWDSWLARVGHAIVMMSLFVALVVKVDTEGDDGFSQDVFAVALVIVNCALLLTVVVEAFGLCSVVVKEIREPVATSRVRVGVDDFGGAISPVG